MSAGSPEVAPTEAISHDLVTLALAKKESAHHYEGTEELFNTMRGKSLWVNAYAMDDPSAPPLTDPNIKVCHFIRQ
jgi:hypothetical protein